MKKFCPLWINQIRQNNYLGVRCNIIVNINFCNAQILKHTHETSVFGPRRRYWLFPVFCTCLNLSDKFGRALLRILALKGDSKLTSGMYLKLSLYKHSSSSNLEAINCPLMEKALEVVVSLPSSFKGEASNLNQTNPHNTLIQNNKVYSTLNDLNYNLFLGIY